MLKAITRDRLIGSAFMGAIWTTLCIPLISGFTPIAAFLEELGPVRFATIPFLLLLWTAAFFAILTLWERRRR